MGGGGTIIIRNAMKALLQDPLVIGAVPTELRPHLDHILQWDPGTWSDRQTRFVIHCVQEAL